MERTAYMRPDMSERRLPTRSESVAGAAAALSCPVNCA